MSRFPVCTTLVHRAETARQQTHRVTLFDKHQLSGEEVLHVHELRIALDDRVRPLLEREHDVDAHRSIATRPDVARFHDAARRARHHQPSFVGHRAAVVDRLLVTPLIWARPRRAEHRHFAR
jgi:hypothetical protein